MIIVVTGTGTEIGKTWVAVETLRALRRRGVAVAARKPVLSYAPGGTEPNDADLLAGATGEQPTEVCPPHRRLAAAMAPPMAAAALGLPRFTIDELAAEVVATAPAGAVVLVESAGGVRSPLADDGDTVALTKALRPDQVVLVADARLGTLNLVRMSVEGLAAHRIVVYLNRFDANDALQVANRDWLVTREGLDVVSDIEALTDRIAGAITG